MDGTGTESTAGVGPTPFCAAGYLIGAKYFVGGGKAVKERKLQPQRKNEDFERAFCPNS